MVEHYQVENKIPIKKMPKNKEKKGESKKKDEDTEKTE